MSIKTCLLYHSFISCVKLFNASKTKEDLLKKLFKNLKKLFKNSVVLAVRKILIFYYHALHDKSIVLPFFVLATFRFLLSVFCLQFKQYDNIVL